MFFPNKKHLHPGFSRNDDTAFVHYCRGVLQYIIGFFSLAGVFTSHVVQKQKTSGVTSFANRLPESPSFPRMLKRRCGNLLLRNRSTIRNAISRNEAISTLGDCHNFFPREPGVNAISCPLIASIISYIIQKNLLWRIGLFTSVT
jgi:hypothetical protein